MSNQATLQVVNFGRSIEYSRLNESLSSLNYCVVPQKGELWLTSTINCTPEPVIVFFGTEEPPSERICQRIDQLSGAQVFAVLSPEHSSWNHSVLDRCHDVIAWPCRVEELAFRLECVYDVKSDQHSQASVPPGLRNQFIRLNLIGDSEIFQSALSNINIISKNDAPTMISGETGTGKELAARAIHYLGTRNGQPFVPVNCGAIPDELFENELFGHEKGAYTDARDLQQGLVEQANRGTLFLDEIDALSNKAQVGLLRFLQDQQYSPLGSSRTKQVDLRIIAATNANLCEMVNEHRFRDDLFFRLNVLSLSLPPLRERTGDVSLLTNHFFENFRLQYKKPERFLHSGARSLLDRYHWPGNIRELENTLLRAFLMAEREVATISRTAFDTAHTRSDDRERSQLGLSFREAKALAVAEFEREYLAQLMLKTGGNVTRAAELAGKERRALGKLLKKHALKN